MEAHLLLFGVLIPSLIAWAAALAPRAVWHGHRRDLPAVESWGVGAAIATSAILSFTHVGGAAAFSSEMWHSLIAVAITAGLASIIVWSREARGSGFLAMVVAFCALLLLRLPEHEGFGVRMATASIGALLALTMLPTARTPSPLAPLAWSAAYGAMGIAALASGHSKIAMIALACAALLALLALPMALNRRFTLGAPGSATAAALLVSMATFGVSYHAAAPDQPLWWWWSAALAPGLACVPSLLHFAPDRVHARAGAALAIVVVALAPAVASAIAHLQRVAEELSPYG